MFFLSTFWYRICTFRVTPCVIPYCLLHSRRTDSETNTYYVTYLQPFFMCIKVCVFTILYYLFILVIISVGDSHSSYQSYWNLFFLPKLKNFENNIYPSSPVSIFAPARIFSNNWLNNQFLTMTEMIMCYIHFRDSKLYLLLITANSTVWDFFSLSGE